MFALGVRAKWFQGLNPQRSVPTSLCIERINKFCSSSFPIRAPQATQYSTSFITMTDARSSVYNASSIVISPLELIL